LAVLNPSLAQELSPRNAKTAYEFTPSSRSKVWWICKMNHEWQATIHNRARGSGCPACTTDSIRSAPEVALTNALAAWLGQPLPFVVRAIPGLHWPRGSAVTPDFAIDFSPIKFVIEYDGIRFHSTEAHIQRDHYKTKMMQDAGFLTIRIREAPLPAMDSRLDLILEPTLIYQDRKKGFQFLTRIAQQHVDSVCRCTYGDTAWENFLYRRLQTS
jgi:hypothetical protein